VGPGIYDRDLRRVAPIAGVISIDMHRRSVEAIATEYARHREPSAMLLALNVRTRQQLLVALDLGFDLFQGLFVEIAAVARGKRQGCVGSSTRPMNRMLPVTLS
jgi:c-di-GMP-related signal transduction protein